MTALDRWLSMPCGLTWEDFTAGSSKTMTRSQYARGSRKREVGALDELQALRTASNAQDLEHREQS